MMLYEDTTEIPCSSDGNIDFFDILVALGPCLFRIYLIERPKI